MTRVGDVLAGLSVLVVEDEFLIAQEIRLALMERGCVVIGPVGSIAEALAQVEAAPPEAAVLNARLADGRVTPVAEALTARGVPFALATGYSESLGPAFEHAPRVTKPFSDEELLCALRQAMQPGRNHRA